MEQSQKDRDQDLALLHLERMLARLDEWKANHKDVHEVEAIQRELMRQSMETRLAGMNEFRASLKDAQDKAVSRDVFDERHDALADRVIKLEANTVTRDEHTGIINRVGRVEALLPIVALLSAAVGAALEKAFGG